MPTAKNDRDSCGNCKFWRDMGGYSGDCRRYPPQIGEFDAASHPSTAKADWCGEHRRK